MYLLFINKQLRKIVFFKYTVDINAIKYTIRNGTKVTYWTQYLDEHEYTQERI